MKESIKHFDISQYMPIAIDWATNILLAIVILLIGIWIANRVYNLIVAISKKYNKLDDTLFRFLGSVARYIVLAFVFIAILNRFGVQTASIVALLGAAGLAVGLALQDLLGPVHVTVLGQDQGTDIGVSLPTFPVREGIVIDSPAFGFGLLRLLHLLKAK